MRPSNKVGPITPQEVSSVKAEETPDEVFKAINSLIASRWDGYKAAFRVQELADAAKKAAPQWPSIVDDLLKTVYRDAGWSISFDYEGTPTCIFTKK